MSEPTLGEVLADSLQRQEEMAPHEALSLSAGDTDTLAELGHAMTGFATTHCDAMTLVKLGEALAFFRLAATSDDSGHKRALVATLETIANTLRELGETDFATHFHGQALWLAEMLSDEGDDVMADMIAANADKLDFNTHLEAMRLRECAKTGAPT